MPQRSVVEAPNPLREGIRIKNSPEPCVMVIFGATGDLTHRKLLPALYNLALEHPLPAGFSVVAFARRGRESVLADLYQRSPCRVLFPDAPQGEPPTAVAAARSTAVRSLCCLPRK